MRKYIWRSVSGLPLNLLTFLFAPVFENVQEFYDFKCFTIVIKIQLLNKVKPTQKKSRSILVMIVILTVFILIFGKSYLIGWVTLLQL